jgi:hypothetical protein
MSDAIAGLIVAASQLEEDAPTAAELSQIIARGEFRPAEDEAIGFWFARFLTTRENLWAIIEEIRAVLDRPVPIVGMQKELRLFLVGYAAVCLLVRIDRLLLKVADHSLVQRKLNEAFPEYRIPRKQFTAIYSGFVDQGNVLAVRDAMQFARKHRRELMQLQDDAEVGYIARQLPELEASLNPSALSHLRRAIRYVSHKWRRRGVSGAEKTFATVLEGFGRVASEFVERDNKRVTPAVLASIQGFLEPGDVIVTRHAKALTNLFFPGYWPHAALYVGTVEQRIAAGVSVAPDKAERWIGDVAVLEAQKDGVRLRPLSETLSVDAFVVLRPKLGTSSITQAIERAMLHEGKKYNFDFDFFNSDRVVCTEVIYRAYDGLEDMEFPLIERAGRKTLSAEDLLDYALDKQTFVPVAIFGVDDHEDSVTFGDNVRQTLVGSYRDDG